MGKLYNRTILCGDINKDIVGNEVSIYGWVQKQRNLGGIIFIWLRDKSGMVQVLVQDDENLNTIASKLRSEFVVNVKGIVQKRDDSAINNNIKNGDIEVIATNIEIINEAITPPIYIDDNAEESESVRLKYRYLDLRKPKNKNTLVFRHNVIKALREYIDSQGFIEIETPILTKSTPEGARDFLVPSRTHFGEFYALPQSPQIYKQLLMVGGLDRYYQVARCFRDEDGRADRQPEFSQFDMEMSFIDAQDIQNVVEGAFSHVFKKLMNIDLALPLQRMTWKEAMYNYGSDKPDTRFDMKIQVLNTVLKNSGFSIFDKVIENNGIISAIKVENCDFSRKKIDSFQELIKTYHVNALSWIKLQSDGEIKSSLSKVISPEKISEIVSFMNMNNNDMVFIVADKEYVALNAMGQLRLNIAKELNLIDNSKYNLFWITEFPLFEWNEDEQRYDAMHHPFTSPLPEDFSILESDPGNVRANAYDLVLNGIEMGSGSIRIHNSDLQKKMFNLLGISDEDVNKKFGFLIEAFKYGTPPHGGFAFGIDRLIMMLLGLESLRDVIAFPKIQNGNCLMMDIPSEVNNEQLDALNISIKS